MDQLHVALLEMLPTGVTASVGRVSDQDRAFQYSHEAQHLANASLARRNEFIAGRHCARAALAQLGHQPCAMPADADGLPIWPSGTLGSISHSRGLCCAVAAFATDHASLGVDVEKTNRLSPAAMARVLHPFEANEIGNDQVLGSLLFSAKEAFFKNQYQVWKAQPSFKDLALKIHTESQHLSVQEIAAHLSKPLRDATLRMQFRYQFLSDYVITLCWLDRT
jgi:4'-phosphopantetheinyl transferase EntD